jgi:hypothetical protein
MKKTITSLLFALITTISFGQDATPTDTLFVNKLGESEYFKKYRNNYQFKCIQLSDGSILEVGDKVTFGKPVGGNRVAQINTGFVSGSVSTTEAYSTMIIGRLGMSIMAGVQWLPSAGIIGLNQKIMEIKKTRIILGDGSAFATILNVEGAFEIGELINPNAPLTRDKAITKLKEQKDLLDLDMITKEQFDKIKLELTPIIMKN